MTLLHHFCIRLANEGNHPIAEATDGLVDQKHRAIGQPEPDRIRTEPVRAASATATRRPTYKGPAQPDGVCRFPERSVP